MNLFSKSTLLALLVCLALLFGQIAQAKTEVTVAVISELGETNSRDFNALYISELQTLVSNEFDLNVVEVKLDWGSADVDEQIGSLYASNDIDMILVMGFSANQITLRRQRFPKPTFLPFVVERELVNAPYENGTSGKKNLNYLTFKPDFIESLLILRDVVKFKHVAILSDELVLASLPDKLMLKLATQYPDLKLSLIAHDGSEVQLVDQITDDIDAVMLGLLPRMSDTALDDLIGELKRKKLPAFTYMGVDLVKRGLLAAAVNDSMFSFGARRNALNMQAVMLGERASDQPVTLLSKPKLTINKTTADQIGAAIDFKTFIGADVVGLTDRYGSDTFDLLSLIETALRDNLELKNQDYNLQIQQTEKNSARAQLLPQLAVDTSFSQRKKDSSIVQSGFAAEQSSDAAIKLSQTLYSDTQWANYKIQSLLMGASNEQLRQTRLDVIQETALAMANVLQNQAESEIQQQNLLFSEKNLELAINRVSLGATSSADQYRWETQVANARSAVFDSYSKLLAAQQNVNRILNRNITAPIKVQEFDMNKLMVYSNAQMFDLMDNQNTFDKVYAYGLQVTLESSPQIKRLMTLQQAKQREVKSLHRKSWLPEVSLAGQVSENIDQQRSQITSSGERDWQIMLNAKLPLFTGGDLSAKRRKSVLELDQLQNQMALLRSQLSQQLRASMNSLLTSLFNLNFSKQAAQAASNSLTLVTDSYAKGEVPIVDLFDAQNANISAELAEVKATIGVFRSSIEMQRTMGQYQFLMTEEQKQHIRDSLQNIVEANK